MVVVTKEKTPYIVTTKLHVYSVSLVYFVTMMCCIFFIIILNYNRIDMTYKNVITKQTNNLYNQIEWYMTILKTALDKHIVIMSKELTSNPHCYCNNATQISDIINTSNSTNDQQSVYKCNISHINKVIHRNSYLQFNIDSIIFQYNKNDNTYTILSNQDDDKNPSKTYNDIKKYIEEYDVYITRHRINSKSIIVPHTLQGKAVNIEINNTWYMITTTKIENTDIYILSAVEIYTDTLKKILDMYIYKDIQNDIIAAPTIYDNKGDIIYHIYWSNTNIYTLNYINKEFLDTRDKIMDYTSQNKKVSGINKELTSLPWIVNISYNKEDVLYKVWRYNVYPLLGLILSNTILIIIFINKIGINDTVLNDFKKQGVVCVCDGECIAERLHCKSLLLTYKQRISKIYEFYYDQLKNKDKESSIPRDTLTLLKDIDRELDNEISKFDDPLSFRDIASKYIKDKK